MNSATVSESLKRYEVTRIPDLTLDKYSAFEKGGIQGVLSKHKAFLRQLHRQGLPAGEKSGQIARWVYIYDPTSGHGKRLRIFLLFEGALSGNLDSYIAASPLAPFYDFTPMGEEDSLPGGGHAFKYMGVLIKREKFTVSNVQGQQAFYSVNEWKMAKDARLINVFSLMQQVDKPCAYTVSLNSCDLVNQIELPEKLGYAMGNLRNVLAPRTNTQDPNSRENADYTVRRYESLIEEISANPHFRANIQVFADDSAYADMLLDAAASEALEKGSHFIVRGNGAYPVADIIKMEVAEYSDTNAPPNLKFWPTLFFLDEIAPFTIFPLLYPGEKIQMSKETAPKHEPSGLLLGTDSDDCDVYFPTENLTKHAFLAGVPGSGKTNSMLHIATKLHEKNIPFLILEPAKREYRQLLNLKCMAGVTVFSPSANTKFPLHINPFQFPEGMELAVHIRQLVRVFEGAFYLEPPMPFLLDGAIEEVYTDKNWTYSMRNQNKLEYPTMSELYTKLEQKLEATDYSADTKKGLKTALQVRIGSLITREMGDVFDVHVSTMPPEEWLKRPIVLELESMGSEPANFMTLLIANLIRETLNTSHIDRKSSDKGPRHVIFFEEAHNLIGNAAVENIGEHVTAKMSATVFIVKMLAEVRALNEAIIIADQLPTAMAPEVVKNTSLKIGHRITAKDDRELLGDTMSADAVQLERMAAFSKGEALITYEGLPKPFEITMKKWSEDDGDYISPRDDELFRAMHENNKFFLTSLGVSRDIMLHKFDAAWSRIDERKLKFLKLLDIHEEKITEQNAKPDMEQLKLEKELREILKAYEAVVFRSQAYATQNRTNKEEIRKSCNNKLELYINFIEDMIKHGFIKNIKAILDNVRAKLELLQ